MPALPTQRTLALLRREGYLAAVVEKWNEHVRIRQDLWGWCDVLALPVVENGAYLPAPLLGVQATSGPNVASRITKLKASKPLAEWLRAGHKAEVWGWAKRGPRGKRKLWTVRRVPLDIIGGGIVCAVESTE